MGGRSTPDWWFCSWVFRRQDPHHRIGGLNHRNRDPGRSMRGLLLRMWDPTLGNWALGSCIRHHRDQAHHHSRDQMLENYHQTLRRSFRGLAQDSRTGLAH